MKHYITIYEFIGGFCLMYWYDNPVPIEPDSLEKVRHAEISLADMFTVGKIYKRYSFTIGSQFAVWNYVY